MNVCSKCFEAPTEPILDTNGEGFFFVLDPEGSPAHLVLDESSTVDFAFKVVGKDYEIEEGEQLLCDECMSKELDSECEEEDTLT